MPPVWPPGRGSHAGGWLAHRCRGQVQTSQPGGRILRSTCGLAGRAQHGEASATRRGAQRLDPARSRRGSGVAQPGWRSREPSELPAGSAPPHMQPSLYSPNLTSSQFSWGSCLAEPCCSPSSAPSNATSRNPGSVPSLTRSGAWSVWQVHHTHSCCSCCSCPPRRQQRQRGAAVARQCREVAQPAQNCRQIGLKRTQAWRQLQAAQAGRRGGQHLESARHHLAPEP